MVVTKYDFHGIVAIVLSIGIVTAIIILSIETILHSGAISEAEATVLSTIAGAIIGAVATYMGVGRSSANGG